MPTIHFGLQRISPISVSLITFLHTLSYHLHQLPQSLPDSPYSHELSLTFSTRRHPKCCVKTSSKQTNKDTRPTHAARRNGRERKRAPQLATSHQEKRPQPAS